MLDRNHEPALIKPLVASFLGVALLFVACWMIVIHFESVKSDERAKLPQHALALPPVASHNRQLLLSLGYGRSAVADRSQSDPVVMLAGSEIPLDRIRPELEGEQATTLRRAAADEVTVVIRADPEVPAGLVQSLIKTCQDVGFSRFSLKAVDAE
ncbi:MAG: hypothetical protein SH850_26720 [Planctomycetaceae bacterium]|nr:hypothetical protein [Planctomycetaceae bacterium]